MNKKTLQLVIKSEIMVHKQKPDKQKAFDNQKDHLSSHFIGTLIQKHIQTAKK